ncbi:MAG: hypothetical protein FJ278_14805, partial [Planctomycetes bacterium]|nr:hypothetical protein [Planctomycetota bacterium]
DNAHTLAHWRTAHWQPKLWTRESFSSWAAAGAQTDADKALDVYREILTRPDPLPQISEASERRLLEIMERAKTHLWPRGT